MTVDKDIRAFQATVWNYYRTHGRHDLPWRLPVSDGAFDPYRIMVSEIMLQQTQVGRVIPKYQAFLEQFPTVESLANAPLAAVLRAWSGLGYNRRAKFLHQAAQSIAADHNGVFPQTARDLQKLPGVGANTAGAIVAYAFNQPTVFIETNIRTVFIHHFWNDQTDIRDQAIIALVEQTLPQSRNDTGPREWYWALMDYGSYLKQTVGNLNHRSRSYAKQSQFEGSRRQIRGQVIRLLGAKSHTRTGLARQISDDRLQDVIDELIQEGLVTAHGTCLSL